jgi:RNA polymerase sigma factor (sigma-70 family)
VSARERLLDELRPHAFAIAYRTLGSISEAEDIVQEALLRLHLALEDGQRIASPRAFVATVTTRLAIDELRSARARRDELAARFFEAAEQGDQIKSIRSIVNPRQADAPRASRRLRIATEIREMTPRS